MKNFNLLKRPIVEETIESWAKNLEDISKFSILTMPVVFYGNYTFLFKSANISGLIIVTNSSLLLAKWLRNNKNLYVEGEK